MVADSLACCSNRVSGANRFFSRPFSSSLVSASKKRSHPWTAGSPTTGVEDFSTSSESNSKRGMWNRFAGRPGVCSAAKVTDFTSEVEEPISEQCTIAKHVVKCIISCDSRNIASNSSSLSFTIKKAFRSMWISGIRLILSDFNICPYLTIAMQVEIDHSALFKLPYPPLMVLSILSNRRGNHKSQLFTTKRLRQHHQLQAGSYPDDYGPIDRIRVQ